MDPLDEIVRLTSARRVGTQWRALCPAHPDESPSLTIRTGSTVPVIVYCHAGCDARDVLTALDLPSDFLSREGTGGNSPQTVGATTARSNGHAGGRARIVVGTTRHEVRDADGTVVAVHVRRDYGDGGKSMLWQHPDGVYSSASRPIRPTELPLYGAHLLGPQPPSLVVVTEGEKAADSLRERTYVIAVGTVTGAASTPSLASLESLRGLDVVLWPDNDEIGRDHMARVARSLDGIAASVTTISVPGLPEHGDAADWTGSLDDLLGLVVEARRLMSRPLHPPVGLTRDAPSLAGESHVAPGPETVPDGFPKLDPAALRGPVGDAVLALEPHTEADPAGVLVALLTILGVAMGRLRTISVVGGGSQAPNLFTMLVGESSLGRKGTAVSAALAIATGAYPDADRLVLPGIGSGEGLVAYLRREVEHAAAKGGQAEYRVLVDEAEMGRLLTAMGREGSTISAILRAAYDGTALGRTVVSSSGTVTWHHVGLLGQSTPYELRQKVDVSERANGFANRFLWIAVRTRRLVPFAPPPASVVPGDALDAIGRAIQARTLGQLDLTEAAADWWEDTYSAMRTERVHGILASLNARAPTTLLRLATIYALLDASPSVDVGHLVAAKAVADYSRASIGWVWGAVTGDPEADALLATLRSEGSIAWTDLYREAGVRGGSDAARVVALLVDAGLVRVVTEQRRGRPRRIVEAIGENV